MDKDKDKDNPKKNSTDPIRDLWKTRKAYMSWLSDPNMTGIHHVTNLSQDEINSLFDDVVVPNATIGPEYRPSELPLADTPPVVEETEILKRMLGSIPKDSPCYLNQKWGNPRQAQTVHALMTILLYTNDNESIRRCLHIDRNLGVESIFNNLYRSLERKLMSLAGSDKVDDAIQDAFRKFITTLFKPNGWKANGSVEGWILRVAQNFHKETQRDRTTPFSDLTRTEEGEDGDSVNMFDERVGSQTGDSAMPLLQNQTSETNLEFVANDDMIDFKQAVKKATPSFDNDQRLVLSLLLEGYDIVDIANVTRLTSYRVGLIWRDIVCMLREAMNGDQVRERHSASKGVIADEISVDILAEDEIDLDSDE